MGSEPEAHVTLARCGIPTGITAAQFAALSALPNPVEAVTSHFVCELVAGHEDDHVAFAVAADGGDKWWWVRWGRQRHVIAHIDLCAAPEPEVPALEFCLFPAGHPGSHSCNLLPLKASNVDGQLN